MKIFFIVLCFLLLGAWFYTSWFWYTCKIKGFCDNTGLRGNIELQSAGDFLGGTTRDDLFARIDNEKISEDISSTGGETDEDTLFISDSSEITSENLKEKDLELQKNTQNVCEPIDGPIEFGEDNKPEEVKKVEEVLIKEGYSILPDQIYGEDDFQAVKDFQLRYKREILDPWGITRPTGYIFRTTLSKMNQILCK